MKTIIIEDDEAMRMLLSDIMEDLCFEVQEAENGRVGLNLLKEQGSVDVMMVDWRTPEMSGLDVVKAVRADTVYDGVKLLMVTGLTEMDEVVEALSAGANEYLMKPYTKEMVIDKLKLLGFQVGA